MTQCKSPVQYPSLLARRWPYWDELQGHRHLIFSSGGARFACTWSAEYGLLAGGAARTKVLKVEVGGSRRAKGGMRGDVGRPP